MTVWPRASIPYCWSRLGVSAPAQISKWAPAGALVDWITTPVSADFISPFHLPPS